jgi:hypothetical protein
MKKQIIYALTFVIITLVDFANRTIAQDTPQDTPQDTNTCLQCHSDAKKMKKTGVSEVYCN